MRLAVVLAACALMVACARTGAAPSAGTEAQAPTDPLAPLRAFERDRRQSTDFPSLLPQDRSFGADPYALAALPDGTSVGLLRGRDVLVWLDRDLSERARLSTPPGASAVAVFNGPVAVGRFRPGDVLVACEYQPRIAHYRTERAAITRLDDIVLAGVRAVRAMTVGVEGIVHLVEEHDHRLLELDLRGAAAIVARTVTVPAGPIRLVRAGDALFGASVLGHAVWAHPLDRYGRLRGSLSAHTIDGPFWGLAAQPLAGGDVLVVAGGAEDASLDRRGGFFGNVDSFLYALRWERAGGALRRLWMDNVSARGLIVPKAITFGHGALLVTAYGSAGALALPLAGDRLRDPAPDGAGVFEAVAGVRDAVVTGEGFALASPLLDAWVLLEPGVAHDTRGRAIEGVPDRWRVRRIVRVDDVADNRTDRERLGEALFYTGLMAPDGSAEGTRSLFSCETCHFEGYVDGRTHHTGRADVRATTKPLVGLFENRPYFSRALDPDLAAVAENEFRVAGASSRRDPHFSLDVPSIPWLGHLGLGAQRYDATELRLALMAYLMRASHRTNPGVVGRTAFRDDERRGAERFATHCEGCHEARTLTDDPTSRVPFAGWEKAILGSGTIVWAKDAYAKTGVLPYVHDSGARVPSLRRLYKKRPYLTNGSARDIDAVLAGVRLAGAGGFRHGGDEAGTALAEEERRELAAFLDLL